MDPSELQELLTEQSLKLLDSLPEWTSADDLLKTVNQLRSAGHSRERVAAVLTQSKLRKRAKAKFSEFASQMLFTEMGLEQATRLNVAALHADRFRQAGIRQVVDLGCGIGGDALALAALGIEVTAVERDPVTATIASFNLAPWPNAKVVESDAESFDLSGFEGVWLDPARRDNSKRLSDPNQWTPPLDFAFEIRQRLPIGIKLSPAMDRILIPEGMEAQWVSVDGDAVELVLWSGVLAREGIARAATVIKAGSRFELVGASDSKDVEIGALNKFLYEPDPVVIRARMIGTLARQVGATMIAPKIAWMSSAERIDTPFANRFEVVETVSIDRKKIQTMLTSHGVGTIEIKTRGVDLDPSEFRKQLKLKGSKAATLILTRIENKRIAVLARRDTEN
ncbi:MAG: class I SAM-dependent methyltransferase [Microbacteriaceae bacterium]|nr:class I SAM-dependent methyltransferase [Microbacteriaceae bacterium]